MLFEVWTWLIFRSGPIGRIVDMRERRVAASFCDRTNSHCCRILLRAARIVAQDCSVFAGHLTPWDKLVFKCLNQIWQQNKDRNVCVRVRMYTVIQQSFFFFHDVCNIVSVQ